MKKWYHLNIIFTGVLSMLYFTYSGMTKKQCVCR